MGFFKRFLSLGSSKSRKNKKKQQAGMRVDAEGRIVQHDTQTARAGPSSSRHQDPDTSASRLLRSTSTKFSVMAEIDYTSLPPLPRSAQDLLATPTLSPSPSLVTVATTPGVQRSGTYVVKVHGRTTHSRTEFPRANPPPSPTKSHRKQPKTPRRRVRRDTLATDDEDDTEHDDGHDAENMPPRLKEVNFTPKDTSRLYNLRRDPSVASLLNLFDDHGCLDSKAFEDSPPTPAPAPTSALEGREPTKRSGSTLRQLLGGAEPAFALNSMAEGDISWAERFLDEQLRDDSPPTSPSTPDLETPKDALFPDTLSLPQVATADVTFSSFDPDTSINDPAINSLEVEVSSSEEDVPMSKDIPAPKQLLPMPDPKTPQRASEVFGFLSRRNTLNAHDGLKERDLPPLPQIITPAHTGEGRDADGNNINTSYLGEHPDATHSANTSHSSTQLTSSDTHSNASHAQIQTATMTKLSTAFAASTTSLNLLTTVTHDPQTSRSDTPISHDAHEAPHTQHPAEVGAVYHKTGSSLASSSSMKVPPSKIPRGPRPRPLSISRPTTLNDNQDDPEVATDDAAVPRKRSTSPTNLPEPESISGALASRRESFTNIPPRHHRRIASRSSGRSVDLDSAPLKDADVARPSRSQSRSKPVSDTPARKRSTKPAHVTAAYGKENTPSPPRAPALPASSGAIPAFGRFNLATPRRAFDLEAVVPPSPASSSELSPVARDMMSDLRERRARARQVERRRGVWVRD